MSKLHRISVCVVVAHGHGFSDGVVIHCVTSGFMDNVTFSCNEPYGSSLAAVCVPNTPAALVASCPRRWQIPRLDESLCSWFHGRVCDAPLACFSCFTVGL